MEYIDRLKDWLQPIASLAYQALLDLFKFWSSQITPRVEILTVTIAFFCVGMLRPQSAWKGISEAAKKTMVD